MHEITSPNGYGIEEEKRYIVHIFQRTDPLPDTFERAFHLIYKAQPTEKIVEQNKNCDATNGSNQPTCKREISKEGINPRAGFVKETSKNRYLRKKSEQCNQQNKQGINGTFGHYSAYGLGKRNAIIMLQYATTGEFAHSGHDKTDGI